MQERGASGNVQTVQFVVLPEDATCQLSGTAWRLGMQGSGLIEVPVKASPVDIHCSKSGHIAAQRQLASTLEEPGGLASEAIIGGFFGFFKSVMIGKGQRYPPLVHVVLPPLGNGPGTKKTLARQREFIKSNWGLFSTGRRIECDGGGTRATKTNLWSVHCDTERFQDYLADDLRAFDLLASR